MVIKPIAAVSAFICVFISITHAETAKLSFDSLPSFIAENKIRTVEDFLSNVPREYLQNYTLSFHSHSLQEADPQDPRVISFGDGSLILTFNGRNGQRGYDKIELMEYRNNPASRELAELSFREGGENTPKFVRGNPSTCLNCHNAARDGEKPWIRANWQGYPVWPGNFGHSDDNLFGGPRSQFGRGDVKPLTPEKLAFLREALEKFNSNRKLHSRYKYLAPAIDHPLAPYADREYEAQLRERPNFQLTMLFDRQNAALIAERIRQSENFQRYPNLTRWVLECFDRPQFYFESYGVPTLAWIPDLTGDWQRIKRYFNAVDPTTETQRRGHVGGTQSGVLARLFPKSAYRPELATGDIPPSEFTTRFQETLYQIAAFSTRRPHACEPDHLLDSTEIDQASEEIRELFFSETFPVSERSVEKILLECASCHSTTFDSQRIAPPLPFDRPSQLRAWKNRIAELTSDQIHEAADGGNRMPLGRKPLTTAERDALLHYLESL